jgi:hypothetical protein
MVWPPGLWAEGSDDLGIPYLSFLFCLIEAVLSGGRRFSSWVSQTSQPLANGAPLVI